MKKTLFIILTFISLTTAITYWQNPDFEIIPQATDDVSSDVKNIWEEWGKVRENYNKKAEDYQTKWAIWNAMASWVFTRSTIIDYIVYLIRFLSQLGLLIWAVMIIYAWYIYASSAFTGKDASWGKKAITNAIIWVLIITFSYAIMKLITSAFIS